MRIKNSMLSERQGAAVILSQERGMRGESRKSVEQLVHIDVTFRLAGRHMKSLRPIRHTAALVEGKLSL